MLNDRFRHPADLANTQFVVMDHKMHDTEHFEVLIMGHTRPIIVPCDSVRIDSAFFGVSITMPRWLAKNRELLRDNTPVPVEMQFP